MTPLHSRASRIGLAALLTSMAATLVAADPFPGEAGVQIAQQLAASFEPSGVAWHPIQDRLFVVSDTGEVRTMDRDGVPGVSWFVGGDLEGVTVAHPMTNFIYLGVEDPDSILEFDTNSGLVTRSFDLTGVMKSDSANSGLEALTFVPDAVHPEGGVFYAGLQEDGRIYVFDLPVLTDASATDVIHLATHEPAAGRVDLAGLHYHAANDLLYTVWDNPNLIRSVNPLDMTLVDEWVLPGNDQEGVAIAGCELFIPEDPDAEVWRYGGFPADPTDTDLDGVADCSDACPQTPAGASVDASGCACGQGGPPPMVCGNGLCEAGDGEDCISCPTDCRGKQKGKASNQYCCGAGGGNNPVSCSDARCAAEGFACSDGSVESACCGDDVCGSGESRCDCADDCGAPPAKEVGADCTNGDDDDCDGLVDCADSDCAADPACAAPTCDGDYVCDPGEDCVSCASDCAGRQSGKPSRRFCCGDAVTAPVESEDPGLCDGND